MKTIICNLSKRFESEYITWGKETQFETAYVIVCDCLHAFVHTHTQTCVYYVCTLNVLNVAYNIIHYVYIHYI